LQKNWQLKKMPSLKSLFLRRIFTIAFIYRKLTRVVLQRRRSAKINAESIEAKVVQDADRLDAMGATGIFRCFAFSGLANRPLHQFADPFCKVRTPDDSDNTLDHFFTKLLHLQDKLNTDSAKVEGSLRLHSMNLYLDSLQRELENNEINVD